MTHIRGHKGITPGKTMHYGFVVLDDSPPFEALWDPTMRWNGWLCPFLDRENTQLLMDYNNHMAKEEGNDAFETFSWNGDTAVGRFYDGEKEWVTEYEPTFIGGCLRWSIGSCSWVWSEASDTIEHPEHPDYPPTYPESRFR